MKISWQEVIFWVIVAFIAAWTIFVGWAVFKMLEPFVVPGFKALISAR